MHKDSIQHESNAYQLEQESKAHDQRVGWQEVLSASDHEGPHGQVLACGSSFGDLSNTPALSFSVLLHPYIRLIKLAIGGRPLQPLCKADAYQSLGRF